MAKPNSGEDVLLFLKNGIKSIKYNYHIILGVVAPKDYRYLSVACESSISHKPWIEKYLAKSSQTHYRNIIYLKYKCKNIYRGRGKDLTNYLNLYKIKQTIYISLFTIYPDTDIRREE